jgi:hypothetical protein
MEHLAVHSKNDLESELGYLQPEAQFLPSQSLFFTVMQEGFAVGFYLAKQVKEAARQ